MKLVARSLVLALLLAGSPVAAGAAAEELQLASSYHPGDRYALTLRATTNRTVAGGAAHASVDENVTLKYSAQVEVLETDAAGHPVRERHDRVQLTMERPEQRGSLFSEDVSYEVRRGRNGQVQLLVGGRRVDPALERVVGALLEEQQRTLLEAALVDPGRPVEVGESWDLDPARARRLLRSRGMRVLSFGEPATATLEREAKGDLVVAYRVPVSWFELSHMPAGALSGASEARLEGHIHLPTTATADARSRSSQLAYHLSGVVSSPGVPQPLPWRVESTSLTAQTTHALERAVPASTAR